MGYVRQGQLRRDDAALAGQRMLGCDGSREYAEIRSACQSCLRQAEPRLGGMERERLRVGQGLRIPGEEGGDPSLSMAVDGGRCIRQWRVARAGGPECLALLCDA